MKLYHTHDFEYHYPTGNYDKTCWFFGDSFTKGSGCLDTQFNDLDENQYFDIVDTKGKTWPNLISEDLKMNKMNLGIGGASIDRILNVFFDYASQIDKDDYVFFGIPPLSRRIFFNERNEPFHLARIDDEKLDNLESYVNFFYEHIELKRALWYEYYLNFIQKILSNFTNNSFIWFVDFMNESNELDFQKIKDVSDINDYHWSFEGHANFYEYVKENINNWYDKKNMAVYYHRKISPQLFSKISLI